MWTGDGFTTIFILTMQQLKLPTIYHEIAIIDSLLLQYNYSVILQSAIQSHYCQSQSQSHQPQIFLAFLEFA
jgi:hypothetical protein